MLRRSLTKPHVLAAAPPPPAPRLRRTLGVIAAATSLAAVVGSLQLVSGTFAPPVSDLEPLGLRSWTLPGLWLAASVALPCAAAAVLAWRGSRRLGTASIGAGAMLGVELLVQIPFVGLDPLQAVMAVVAVTLVGLGVRARHTPSEATT